MTTHLSRFANAVLRAVLFSLCLSFPTTLQGANAGPRSFDLPADAAEKSLKRFSEQTALEVFYPSSVVTGVNTKAIKGVMSARAALDAMLAGTGLVVVQDSLTGAFSLQRAAPPAASRSTGPDSATNASGNGNGGSHVPAASPPRQSRRPARARSAGGCSTIPPGNTCPEVRSRSSVRTFRR